MTAASLAVRGLGVVVLRDVVHLPSSPCCPYRCTRVVILLRGSLDTYGSSSLFAVILLVLFLGCLLVSRHSDCGDIPQVLRLRDLRALLVVHRQVRTYFLGVVALDDVLGVIPALLRCVYFSSLFVLRRQCVHSSRIHGDSGSSSSSFLP